MDEIDDVDHLVELAGKFIPDIFPFTIDNPGPYKVINNNILVIDGITYEAKTAFHGDQIIHVDGLPHDLCFQEHTPFDVAVYYIRKAVYERDKKHG